MLYLTAWVGDLEFEEGEGLALVNGSPYSTAVLADAAVRARNRLTQAEALFALSADAFRAPLEAYDEALDDLWADQYQVEALRALRAHLAGADTSGRLSHQAPVSFRMQQQRQLGLRPAQLSGGLKQRVAIARAFAGNPTVLVCDEPTSALDVSVQAAILNLLAELQGSKRVTYLFISHDLGVVRYLSDRIAVLYLGRLMEYGDAEAVFAGPHHPYTEALLSAVPSLEGLRRERIILSGEIPSPANPPSGCVFHTRCPRRLASGVCESTEPPLAAVEPGHFMRCHIPPDELRQLQNVEGQ